MLARKLRTQTVGARYDFVDVVALFDDFGKTCQPDFRIHPKDIRMSPCLCRCDCRLDVPSDHERRRRRRNDDSLAKDR